MTTPDKSSRRVITIAAAVCASTAFADTGVSTSAYFMDYSESPALLVNGITGGDQLSHLFIEHGCADAASGGSKPVIAQKVVLPSSTTDLVYVVTKNGGGSTTQKLAGGLPALQTEGFLGIDPVPGSLVTPMLPQGPFTKTQFTYDPQDPSNILKAWLNTKGSVPGNGVYSYQPITTHDVSFADNNKCVKSFTLALAVADVCKTGNVKPTSTNGVANTWIPQYIPGQFGANAQGSSGPEGGGPQGTDSRLPGGKPVKVTWYNKKYDPSACGGSSHEIFVYPSNDDVSKNLGFPGFK